MKNLRYFIIIFIMLFAFQQHAHSQDDYTGFGRIVDISGYKGKSFTFSCATLSANTVAIAVCYGANGRFIKSYLSEPIQVTPGAGKWDKLVATGKLNKEVEKVFVGVLYKGAGDFFYDNLNLVLKGGGKDENVMLKNGDFEEADTALASYKFTKNVNDVAMIAQDPLNPGNRILKISVKHKGEEDGYGQNSKAGNFVNVNGIKLYYETYGSGAPLLLLHGALESITSYAAIIPALSKQFKVIAIDTRGHGKSTADTMKLTYDLYANDIYNFINALKLDSVYVLGWSDGGNTGLLLAMNHPDKVKRLAVMGANLYNDKTSVPDWVNDTLRSQIKQLESTEGTKRNDFELRVKKTLLTEPNISPESLGKIKCPALIMAGEHDIIKEGHTRLIAKSISHSTLMIFKNATHYAPDEIPEIFSKTVIDFFIHP